MPRSETWDVFTHADKYTTKNENENDGHNVTIHRLSLEKDGRKIADRKRLPLFFLKRREKDRKQDGRKIESIADRMKMMDKM